MQRIHHQIDREQLVLDLDVIARQGARRMLAQALEAEVEAYLEAAKDERDENGLALVIRNGYARRAARGRVRGRQHRGEGAEGERPAGGQAN